MKESKEKIEKNISKPDENNTQTDESSIPKSIMKIKDKMAKFKTIPRTTKESKEKKQVSFADDQQINNNDNNNEKKIL